MRHNLLRTRPLLFGCITISPIPIGKSRCIFGTATSSLFSCELLYQRSKLPFIPNLTTCCIMQHATRNRSQPSAALLISQSPANHSPRVLAHCQALLQSQTVEVVLLIAQPPSPPNPPPNLIFVPLTPPTPQNGPRTIKTLFLKATHNVSTLINAIQTVNSFDFHIQHVILSVPPAIPLLPCMALMTIFRKDRTYTIDWHNFAFSIMQTTSSPPLLVRFSRFIELSAARVFSNHWVVSNAMADFLADQCALESTVVYDRPRPEFRHALANKAQQDLPVLCRARDLAVRVGAKLEIEGDDVPPVVVTSTSWTPDEDFAMLLVAISKLEEKRRRVIIVITGKGPLREQFEDKVRDMQLEYVAVWFVWMPADDYPLLLAACQLGVSLHASSSGLDLPMKAVDMLGSGLPVVALRYNCIDELVIDGTCGVLFDDAGELAESLDRLLFQAEGKVLADQMRTKIGEMFSKPELMWQASWERDALPSLRQRATALGWSAT